MSDVPPPGDLPESESEMPTEAGGLWHRYRSLPVWLQILAPLVVLAVIVGGIVWATSGSDGDLASSESTTTAGDSALEVVVKGLIVGGGLSDSSVPTTDAPAGTPNPTSMTTTMPPTTATATTTTTTTTTTTAPARPVVPTTSARPTTTRPPTTSAPDTVEPPDTTDSPETTEPPDTTDSPESTEPPDTTDSPETTEPLDTTDAPETIEPPDTTDAPETTEPSDSTEVSTTTAGASLALPSVAAFFAQWNDATPGTDVPTISGAEARALTGDYAGYYLIPLTASGSTLPPQVGLVGTATAPGSGQLAEVMLVWIPGSDESSRAFYWDCFGVLVKAVSPGATPDEIADLASTLGRAPDTPPFTRSADVSSGGLDYQALTLPYSGEAGTLDVSAIEIS